VTEIVLLSLALWIVTHTIAEEIPITANAPKPLSCQLCISGWACIALGAIAYFRWSFELMAPTVALAIWALSVIAEAVYDRLRIVIM